MLNRNCSNHPPVCIYSLIFLIVTSSPLPADLPARMGGGVFPLAAYKTQLQTLENIGFGYTRLPISMEEYWNGSIATPKKADQQVLECYKRKIVPMLLFEFYTRYKIELGNYDKWLAIGKAFAERFSPNSRWLKSQGITNWGVTHYSAINEPEWEENNPIPIPPEHYSKALEGLSDGIHAVDSSLIAAPGGYQEGPLLSGKDPYIHAVAHLFNSGKLGALDIHRYWDLEYIPMSHGLEFSLQKQFDDVKKNTGITANIKFYTTETNYKKRIVDENEAASGLLTCLWDALTVVDNEGKPTSQFTLVWNIFNTTESDPFYGVSLNNSEPWNPTARGKVLQLIVQLTRGLDIESVDPKQTGVTTLTGNGKKMWVWQNRKGWSSLYGTSLPLKGIPGNATALEVYGWNGLIKSYPLNGEDSRMLSDLPADQTLMLVASRK